MIGQKKYISFKNSIKMELDGPSLDRITEDAILTMKSAAFHNVLVRKYRFQTHSFNYNSAEICLPGHRVPRQFKHRSTTNSSITMNISNSLGFIFAVVVSPSNRTKKHGYFVDMDCQCYSEDGRRHVGYTSRWSCKPITNLNMDHVFVWYDPYHSDSIIRSSERKISFKFYVTTFSSSRRELDSLLSIKECGVCTIYYSESQIVLGTGNENCHRSYDCLIVSKDTQVHENPQEKENLDECCTKSGQETETSSHKQEQFEKGDSSEGCSDVESSFNKAIKFKSTGNEGRPTESEAALHLSPVSTVEKNSDNKSSVNNYDWPDNCDETKNPEEKPNIQGEQIIVPETNDLISEPEQEKENAPITDLSKHEDGSDDDPFAELDSILLGSPESSPKATCSTSDVAVREALHNLESLLENSLESILSDVELQQQLHMSLEYIKQASHENVSPNVVTLVQKMTSSVENLFEDFVMTKNVVDDHINAIQQKEKLMQRVTDAKKQKESKQKEKSQFEDEAKRVEEEVEKTDEKIRILVEQKKILELEKTKLKESMEKCEGEKKKVEDEAKNMITEGKELMASIKKSKSSYTAALSKQQKLKDKWEGFRVEFADNLGSSSS